MYTALRSYVAAAVAGITCVLLCCKCTHAVVTTVANSTQLLAAVANGVQFIEVIDHIDFRSFDDYEAADSPAASKSAARTYLMTPESTTESIVVRLAVVSVNDRVAVTCVRWLQYACVRGVLVLQKCVHERI